MDFAPVAQGYVFQALADSTRRELLHRLLGGPKPVKDLAAGLPMTRPAVSRHLGVLRRAGMVSASKQGREVRYALTLDGREAVDDWVVRCRSFEAGRLVVVGDRAGEHHPRIWLSSAAVFVSDQDRALAFYRDVLGFQVIKDRESAPGFRWISVAPPDGSAVLNLQPRSPNPRVGSQSSQPGVWTGIYFMTDDIRSLYNDLSARGVAFDGPPVLSAWGGVEATFADPDGNRFELVQLPDASYPGERSGMPAG